MDISFLEEFVVLARELNFTTSATLSHVSQSSLTRHIQAIEREIGCQLFVRGKNSVSLTEQGAALLPGAQATIACYESALETVHAAAERRSTRLTVAYQNCVDPVLLKNAYADQLARRPYISFSMLSTWEYRTLLLLERGKAELAIMPLFGKLDSSMWNIEPLYESSFSMVVPPTHPLYGRDSAQLKQLGNGEAVLIANFRDSPDQCRFLTEALKDNAPGTAVQDRLRDIYDAAVLPNAGAGVAIVPNGTLHQISADPQSVVPMTDECLRFQVCAVWQSNATNPTISDFLQTLHAGIPDVSKPAAAEG